MRAGLALLLVISLPAVPGAQPASEILETPGKIAPGVSDRWEFVAFGEVIAVQKDRGALRILGPEPETIGKRPATGDLQQRFLKELNPLTLLDRQGRVAGEFRATRVEIEHGHRPAGRREVVLYGYFQLEQVRILSVGYRAGLYRKKLGYLRPGYDGSMARARKPLREFSHHVDGKSMVYIPERFVIFGQGDDPGRDSRQDNADLRQAEINQHDLK